MAHLPFINQPDFLALGARRIPAAQWLTPALPAYHAHQLELAAQQDDVFCSLPCSEAAQHELQATLADHLCDVHRDSYHRTGEQLTVVPLNTQSPLQSASDPLWHASLWIADDLCLLQRAPDGWVLCAASLCAPSHWRLKDKIGRPLADIHAPVPGLQQTLGTVIDRTLDKLADDDILERGNWTITDSDQLAQFASREHRVDANQRLFLRVERQSLRKLPATGAVVFAICVEITALDTLEDNATAVEQLLKALVRLEPAVVGYKSLQRLTPALARFAQRYGVALPGYFYAPG